MPTVGATLMLDRLGPKRSDAGFVKSKQEAPGARYLLLADLKPVIRSNPERTTAKLAWFSGEELAEFGLPTCGGAVPGRRQGRQRPFRGGRDRASHAPRARRHREAAAHRRSQIARHAGHHVARGAVAVRPGPRAGAVARERALLRPLRRHHAGQGRRLAAQVLGVRARMVPAHRSRGHHADHGRRALPAGARAPLWRQDVLDARRLHRARRGHRACRAPRGAGGDQHQGGRGEVSLEPALAVPAFADARLHRPRRDHATSPSTAARSRRRAGSRGPTRG